MSERLSSALFFPPVETALTDPNGLLAMGGDLSMECLLDAYRHGIFPCVNPGDPILWWSPIDLLSTAAPISHKVRSQCVFTFFPYIVKEVEMIQILLKKYYWRSSSKELMTATA